MPSHSNELERTPTQWPSMICLGRVKTKSSTTQEVRHAQKAVTDMCVASASIALGKYASRTRDKRRQSGAMQAN
eukprot:1287482-Rhodomonas_salina.1